MLYWTHVSHSLTFVLMLRAALNNSGSYLTATKHVRMRAQMGASQATTRRKALTILHTGALHPCYLRRMHHPLTFVLMLSAALNNSANCFTATKACGYAATGSTRYSSAREAARKASFGREAGVTKLQRAAYSR